MAEDGYPKWVRRSPDIGPVLVQSKEEEDKLLADFKNRAPDGDGGGDEEEAEDAQQIEEALRSAENQGKKSKK